MQRFTFNTGVLQKDYPSLTDGQEWAPAQGGGFVKVIPFYCKDVPRGAVYLFSCNYDYLHKDNPNIIVREIYNSSMLSKFAYFEITPEQIVKNRNLEIYEKAIKELQN